MICLRIGADVVSAVWTSPVLRIKGNGSIYKAMLEDTLLPSSEMPPGPTNSPALNPNRALNTAKYGALPRQYLFDC